MADDIYGFEGVEPVYNPKNLEDLKIEGYSVDIPRYVREGWEIFKSDPSGFLIYALIFFLINIGLSCIPLIGALATLIISPALAMGFFIVSAKKLKSVPYRFEDFFKGFNYFIPLALVGVASSILIGIGFFLFIIPGIYLFVGYLFASMLVVDRNLTFWEALETSRKIVTRNWFPLFGLTLALMIMNGVGMLLFIIGVTVTTVISFCILTAAYEDIIGLRSTSF